MGIIIGQIGNPNGKLDRMIIDYASTDGDAMDLSGEELIALADVIYGKGESQAKEDFKKGLEDYVELKSSFSANELANYRNLRNVDRAELAHVQDTLKNQLKDDVASKFIEAEGEERRMFRRMTSMAEGTRLQGGFFIECDNRICQTVDKLRAGDIVPLLTHDNPELRRAIAMYVELGGDPKALIPLLNSHEYRAAIEAYVKLKGNPDDLIGPMCDAKAYVPARRNICHAYVDLKGNPEKLIDKVLGNSDIDTKLTALEAYAWVTKDAKLIEKFLDGNENPRLTEKACELYGDMGGNPMKLVSLFDHSDPRVRNAAMKGFGRMKGANPIHLVRFLNTGNPAALYAYVDLNGDPKELVGPMGNPDIKARQHLFYAYEKLNGDPSKLTGLFSDKDAEVRVIAMNTYGNLHGDPKALVPFLNDKDARVASTARIIYRNLGGDQSLLIEIAVTGDKAPRP